MMGLWQRLVPELRALPMAEQAQIVASARKSPFAPGETVLMVAWLILVFLFVRAVIGNATHENKVAFALVANLSLGAPLLCAVFAPIYLRKMCRHIRGGIASASGPSRTDA